MATSQVIDQHRKVVGALFADRKKAQDAVTELVKRGFARDNITILQQYEPKSTPEARQRFLAEAGYGQDDVVYFTMEVEKGKTLVSVWGVDENDTGTVIHVLNKNGSHYDPDGSRNVRDDVVGMTTGAAVGGAVGGIVGGPLGAAVGGLAGAAVGGVIGKGIEESE